MRRCAHVDGAALGGAVDDVECALVVVLVRAQVEVDTVPDADQTRLAH